MTDYTMTLTESYIMRFTLGAAPTGDWYGAVVVNGTAHKMKQVSDTIYEVKMFGGRVGRCTLATVYAIFGDTLGVTTNSADRLSVTTPAEPFIPEPMEWVRDTLLADWDTNFLPLPLVEFQNRIKQRRQEKLSPVHITLAQGLVTTEVHAQGRYKTNEYPVEITVRSEGRKNSEALARNGMAETIRVIEMNWNGILHPSFDYVKYSDDAVDMSMEYAGKFEWKWRIRLKAVLRGRAGTPADPS